VRTSALPEPKGEYHGREGGVSLRVGRASRPSSLRFIHWTSALHQKPCLWLSNWTHGAWSNAGRAGRPSYSDWEQKGRSGFSLPGRAHRLAVAFHYPRLVDDLKFQAVGS